MQSTWFTQPSAHAGGIGCLVYLSRIVSSNSRLRNFTLGYQDSTTDSGQVCQGVNHPHSSCSELKVHIRQKPVSALLQRSLIFLEGARSKNKSNSTPKIQDLLVLGWSSVRQNGELWVADSREPASLDAARADVALLYTSAATAAVCCLYSLLNSHCFPKE